jgi:Rrf2 family iron-sulfur cluster assembly transcriptional regulator
MPFYNYINLRLSSMNLTTKGRYAVMAMADLAMQGGTTPITLSEIAIRQNIALNYLEQIFMKLRKKGLVKSVRGPGGGYIIPIEPVTIKIADIVIAVDESIKMTRCADNKNQEPGGCMHGKSRCLTHNLWDGLGHQIFKYLNSISLADICNANQPKVFFHPEAGEIGASV